MNRLLLEFTEAVLHYSLSIANHGYGLHTGPIVLSDTAENLRQNDMVRKAYLGIE